MAVVRLGPRRRQISTGNLHPSSFSNCTSFGTKGHQNLLKATRQRRWSVQCRRYRRLRMSAKKIVHCKDEVEGPAQSVSECRNSIKEAYLSHKIKQSSNIVTAAQQCLILYSIWNIRRKASEPRLSLRTPFGPSADKLFDPRHCGTSCRC